MPDESKPVVPPSGLGALPATIRVRLYRPGDEEMLVPMLASIFDRPRSVEDWRWLFERSPEGPAIIHVLESEGRIVGQVGHVPGSVWVDGRKLRLVNGCNLMVEAEFRRQGGMALLIEGFLASEHGSALNIAVTNERSAELMRQYAGTATLGKVVRWRRWHVRGRRLPAPARGVLTGVERLYGGAASLGRPPLRVEELEQLGADVDELAHDSAGFARCIRVRDAAYLRWRWLEEPELRFRMRAARALDGGLRGLAVFGASDEPTGRRGRIVDLLARDLPSMRALVLDAFEALVDDGCRIVTCDYHDPRPWARRAFLRSGFRSTPGQQVSCGSLSPSAGGVVEQLESWYLTNADMDI